MKVRTFEIQHSWMFVKTFKVIAKDKENALEIVDALEDDPENTDYHEYGDKVEVTDAFSPMNVFKEWRTIEIPSLFEKWEDISYHNDACGSLKKLNKDGSGFILWVEHEKKEDREEAIDGRYVLLFFEDIEEDEQNIDNRSTVYVGDISGDAYEKARDILRRRKTY